MHLRHLARTEQDHALLFGRRQGKMAVKSGDTGSNAHIAEIIESRSPAGSHDAVRGWHNLLKKMLSKFAPYLQEGRLVTFQNLKKPEKAFFETSLQNLTVPPAVHALYIAPSVRFQMLYDRPDGVSAQIPDHDPENPPDEGILLACRKDDLNIIVNALLAKAPFTPAIDVYQNGALLAGYVFNTMDACLRDFPKVMQTHLAGGGLRTENRSQMSADQ